MGKYADIRKEYLRTGDYAAGVEAYYAASGGKSVKPTIDTQISGIPRPELVMDGDPGVMAGGHRVGPGGTQYVKQPMTEDSGGLFPQGERKTGGLGGTRYGAIKEMAKSGIDTGSTMPVADLKSRKWLLIGIALVIGFLMIGAMKK